MSTSSNTVRGPFEGCPIVDKLEELHSMDVKLEQTVDAAKNEIERLKTEFLKREKVLTQEIAKQRRDYAEQMEKKILGKIPQIHLLVVPKWFGTKIASLDGGYTRVYYCNERFALFVFENGPSEESAWRSKPFVLFKDQETYVPLEPEQEQHRLIWTLWNYYNSYYYYLRS